MKRLDAAQGAAWVVAVAIGLLSAILIGLYVKARAYDEASLIEQAAVLRHIKQLDAQWESDALKSRVGLNDSYDPLTAPMVELRQLRQQLIDVAPAWSSNLSRGELKRASSALQQALDDKERLIERFKSHNAILRNSLTFLPTAANDLRLISRQVGDSAPRRQLLGDAVGNVLLATLQYSQAATNEQAAYIKAEQV
ncbi:DAHL domain-containing protein [Roseateles saccharophilus]|uniref:DAHL domain-containing protein n=1 Tax=Roseateles saccharophilus TaxID=304 RepID=A0A4R3U5I8_ROSSA|nr:DAHL domain-containing protein [Roseateles saccharophilus]MDG0836267.1 hypothetical protein [Roseateles saccharophilus]TCU81127.1 hypothetical protein EV671_10921 [Roseateles saccharophilus]